MLGFDVYPLFDLAPRGPLAPPSLLRLQPPLDFHGRYDCLHQPQSFLTPHQTPFLDIFTFGNDPTLVHQAMLLATLSATTANLPETTLLSQTAQHLIDGGAIPDWQLWRVRLDQRYGLKLYYMHTDGVQSYQVRTPLPNRLTLSFRIFQPGCQYSSHKLYLDVNNTPQCGHELKVAEWRNQVHPSLTMVTWYLDRDNIILDAAMRPGGHLMELIDQEQQVASPPSNPA